MIRELNFVKVIIPFIWVGFVAATSFMEAWLKFTAPGVTIAIGLGIGKIVFSALNRVEIFFCAVLLLVLLVKRRVCWSADPVFFGALLIVCIQSVWILPVLSARVAIYQAGSVPPPSDMHLYFVALEIVKVVCLLIYGSKQLTVWKI